MQREKQPAPDAILDGTFTEADVEQLRPRDHAVLAVRQRGDFPIGSSVRLTPYFGAK
jgi:hypothetical protein